VIFYWIGIGLIVQKIGKSLESKYLQINTYKRHYYCIESHKNTLHTYTINIIFLMLINLAHGKYGIINCYDVFHGFGCGLNKS
jgi:hypothetical protein